MAHPVPIKVTRKSLGDAQARTQFLVKALGSQASLAELLKVSISQPSRWAKGTEAPSPQRSRELVDLDHIVARASLLWPADVVHSWLSGSNAFLDGARPIDVLRVRGANEVITALDAETSGAMA